MIEFSNAGPGGVGLYDDGTFALDSIVIFSDPLGLGSSFSELSPEGRVELAARYTSAIRERFPSASGARMVNAGEFFGFQMELPSVAMADRPIRAGRHYLLFSGRATASVDCLWTEEHAAQMSKGCDAVAAGLERHRRRR